MGYSCAIIGCSKRYGRDKLYRFYRLPSVVTREGKEHEELTRKRQRKWLENISRSDIKTSSYNNIRVCSDHFVSGQPSYLYDQTNPDWAPTKNLGHMKISEASVKKSIERNQRLNKRKSNIIKRRNKDRCLPVSDGDAGATNETLTAVDKEVPGVEAELNGDECFGPVNEDCQTDLSSTDIASLEKCLENANEEIYSLRKQIVDLNFNMDSFRNDDGKVRYFTGLPNFQVLLTVYNFVAPSIATTQRNSLTKFQELLIVLIRLRLNSSFQDLGYRFSVSVSTISRIFYRWLPVLDARLSFLICWPEREELQKTMPVAFRKSFGTKVAVIVDCFEVFIDRPSTLSARAMTWSSYKHHNTAKFLIGITPQGVISFISNAWGGRVSDKHITENCKLLDNLLPGDLVLADRGFDIADSVGLCCAKLAIPAFTRGKSQLSALEVEETRKIANVRIHVERVIGLVRRKYQILQATLPIETLMYKDGQQYAPIDKIARICCALTNLSPSVVPFE